MQMLGASGGAGGGTRTGKGFRPETCEVSAFTIFATPSPGHFIGPRPTDPGRKPGDHGTERGHELVTKTESSGFTRCHTPAPAFCK